MAVGGARTGALGRSLRAMTVGAISSTLAARDAYAEAALGEIDQQFHVPVSGPVTTDGAWAELDVMFATPFLDAYHQRQSPYVEPTFTFGVVFDGAPMFVIAGVTRWLMRDEMYVGAHVAVGAMGTGTFRGEVHLNFQGYGPPDASDDDEGVEG